MHNVCRQILNFYSQSQDKLRKKNTHKLRVNGKLNILLKTFSFAYRKIFKEKNRQNKKRPWTISSFVATDQIYNCTMHQFWVLCSKYRRRAFDAHIYTHTHTLKYWDDVAKLIAFENEFEIRNSEFGIWIIQIVLRE